MSVAVLGSILESGSEEHAALERLIGEPLRSDSAELCALVLLGVDRVRESLLEDAYNAAVDAGDFDESRAWVEQDLGRTATSACARVSASNELLRGSV